MHGQISSLTDYPLKNHIRRSSGICAMKTLEKLFSCQNFQESRTVGVEWKRRKMMEAFNLLRCPLQFRNVRINNMFYI